MADAIHEIGADGRMSLEQVAALYVPVTRPGGDVDPARLARVIAAIRARTGSSLHRVADAEPLPAKTVLRIPTLREMPRAVLCDHAQLRAALMAAGYDHANKLLQRTVASVLRVLGPYTSKPFGPEDVTRAYALTSLFDLDGMDTRTALYLHDTGSVRSLEALAGLPEASLQSLLDRLVEGQGRPADLAKQGHAARWRASAAIQQRRRVAARVRYRPYQIPFSSTQAAAQAEHYEALSRDGERGAETRTLARRLGLLRRFQAQVIDGNFYALARRWDRSGAAHMTARRLFHRLAEDVGAAANVDDEAGVGLDVAIDTVHRLLKDMPPESEAPLGAPPLRATFDDFRRPYRIEAGTGQDRTKAAPRVVLLPAAAPDAPPVRLALDADSFVADYKTTFLNPQLGGAPTGAVRIDSAAWVDAAAFAAVAPYLYGGPVRAALGLSFARQGQVALANRYASPYFDLVAADGIVVNAWSNRPEYIQDLDLGMCSTAFVDPDGDGTGVVLEEMYSAVLPLASYCDTRLAAGDTLYQQDRRDEASTTYADVACAIENYWKATGQSFLAADAHVAFAAVTDAALTIARGGVAAGRFRSVNQLTLLAAAHEDGSPTTPGYVTCIQGPKTGALEDVIPRATEAVAARSGSGPTMRAVPDANVNGALSGTALDTGAVKAFVDARLIDAYYFEYLYAQAKLQAIASGLNWFGFSDSFVPSWSFEYLYDTASDLAAKAVDTERQVFQLLQLLEQAEEREFLAGQALALADEQLVVADARVAQAETASALASQQAALAVAQAEAAATQSAFRGGIEFDSSEVQPALVPDPATGEVVAAEDLFSGPYDITQTYDPNPGGAILNSVLSGIPYFGSVPATKASIETARNDFVSNLAVLQQAVAVAQATEVANAAACATAAAERDVAMATVNQAQEYLGFLQDQTLNSEGLEQLVALAGEVHGIYQYQAHRMAWLAQRAAAYESRRSFAFIGWDYETGEQLHDMMSSEFLRADLDALHAELTAGQTLRLQEVRWTLPLSRLDAGALYALRTTGRATFVLRQEAVDREFPGTFLHRLKDLQLAFIGLLPPGGARGVLSMTGISWVRVPNTGEYASGETRSDWTTDARAMTDTPYDSYVMKRLDATPADLSLSEFDAVSDRGVLSVPRGMLRPLENLGLDTAWTLTLPRRSNAFAFDNIRDIELTFRFLASYDPLLQAAQDLALSELGNRRALSSAARLSAVAGAPDQLAALRGPASAAQVDTRFLVWRLAGLPPGEAARRVRNLGIVCARRVGTPDEIGVRLLSQSAPAGVRVSTDGGAAVSFVGVSTKDDPDPPVENAALSAWLRSHFYAGTPREPTQDPQQRWVLKFCAEQAGEAWEAKDEDGVEVLSRSGPLTAGRGGLAVYDDGTTWTSYVVGVNLRKNGGEAHVLARYDAATGNGYVLVIGSRPKNNVALFKLTGGSTTALAQATIPYADDEFLSVTLSVFGDDAVTTIRAEVDRIPVLEATDASAPHTQGTVGLRVAAVGTAVVPFSDLQVVRLTRLGLVRESLLSEPLADGRPPGWTFTDGAAPWAVSPTRFKRLDLSKLLNVVLTVDYGYTIEAVPAGPRAAGRP